MPTPNSSNKITKQTGFITWIILIAIILTTGGAWIYRERKNAASAKAAADAAEAKRIEIEIQAKAVKQALEEEIRKKVEIQAKEKELEAEAEAEKQKITNTPIDLELERKNAAIEAAKTAIKNRLTDPESANFRNISVFLDYPGKEIRNTLKSNTNFVCGEFNAKNKMGGYVGFEPFYWTQIDNDITVPVKDSGEYIAQLLREIINKNCNKALKYTKIK